jgi:ABC-type antimicrobial peptide transport system permease subunit
MHKWLENFAYHININAGVFITAIMASFIIAACTIAYQAIKAALANPVKSLKSEPGFGRIYWILRKSS